MGALKTSFVLLLLLVAGGISYLSIQRDPLGGEPYQLVSIETADVERLYAEAEKIQSALLRERIIAEQRAIEEQRQREQQQQAEPQALSQTESAPELQQTNGGPLAGVDIPVTGQAPPSVRIDPNAGVTATDLLP